MEEYQNTTPSGEETAGESMNFDVLLQQNKEFQSEFDRRVSKALDTAKAKWHEQTQQERSEAQRLADVAQEQRKQELEQLQAERESLNRDRAEFEHSRRVIAVEKLLAEQGIPQEFARWLTCESETESVERAQQFAKEFQTSLHAEITGKLRGNAPDKDAEQLPSMERRLRMAAGLK